MTFKFQIFIFLILIIKNINNTNTQKNEDEIKCSICNHSITNSNLLIEQASLNSLTTKFDFRFNKNILIHTFKNPNGVKFQVITSKKANLTCEENEFEEYSFFKSFKWRICYCPVCGTHHGWQFSPNDKLCEKVKNNNDKTQCKEMKKFYGIVTTRLKDPEFTGEKHEL
jgi:hypothetical protein